MILSLPRLAATCILSLGLSTLAHAATVPLDVTVDGIRPGKPVPEANVRCKPTARGRSTDGKNLQPTIQWGDAPKETKSFAIFVMDPDVPADFTDAGKEGKTIPADAPRKDFFHFARINIPAATRALAATDTAIGTPLLNDMGINKYVPTETSYGGPCPPWNDKRLHHYHFIVMALGADAPLDAPGNQTSAAATYARLVTSKRILAQGEVVGTYTLNKTLRK
ncbi:MAG: YbhB/YbcL family Raf kinase inhibitor-like protein [Pseudomonadota bacterium]